MLSTQFWEKVFCDATQMINLEGWFIKFVASYVKQNVMYVNTDRKQAVAMFIIYLHDLTQNQSMKMNIRLYTKM